MSLGAVTEIDVHEAVKNKIVAASGWFDGVPVHFGRRPPNADEPPYVHVAVEEQDDPEAESDGAVAQRFMVEIGVKAVGSDDAEAAAAALVALDPRWGTLNHGVNLTDTDKAVTAVYPRAGRLRLLEALSGGEDRYTAQRRWEIWTAAHIGA